jgi:NADPH:quinone reductase-like Zn-dependent oxidoreductase
MTGVYIMRPMTGFRRPKPTRPGVDLAGEVEAVGKNVTRFKVGDAVFGSARGTFAEYACAREDRLALKPVNVSFEQAAAISVAGLTALQGIRDKGRVRPGQKVLINGAAGGVGTFAVQIGKSFGAHVTGVCTTASVDLVRSLGADHVIDYTQKDFTKGNERYDVILDCVGNRSLWAERRVMAPTGIVVNVGARPGGGWVGPLPRLAAVVASSLFVKQKVTLFVAKVGPGDLNALKDLVEANRLTPVVDRCYAFSESADAIRYLKAGHTRGKVVVSVQQAR